MHDRDPTTPHDLRQRLARDGFVFVDAEPMRTLIARAGPLSDWDRFAASWDDLALDTYLVDSGRFRRRRHGVFAATPTGTVQRLAHQPHYQSRAYNSVYGGIERWFEPILDELADGASLRTIIGFCAGLFGAAAAPSDEWRVEVHQFRIEARPGEPGQPTPEGMHRDGVDFVLVLMIGRRNIASGTTTIHAPDGALLGSFTLAQPFDAALVDDARVLHGVTPVEALDASQPAHRDVLVLTFKARHVDAG